MLMRKKAHRVNQDRFPTGNGGRHRPKGLDRDNCSVYLPRCRDSDAGFTIFLASNGITPFLTASSYVTRRKAG